MIQGLHQSAVFSSVGPGAGGGLPALAAISDLAAITVGPTRIDLTWTDSPDATEFRLYRATVSGGPWTLIDTFAPGETQPYQVETGLSPATAYFFYIESFRAADSATADSNEVTDTTDAISPIIYPNLHRWYRADDFVGNDGDFIGGGGAALGPWIDATGSGDNASGAGGGTYETNVVGSMPVIRITISNLTINTGALTDFTLIVAGRQTGPSCFVYYHSSFGHQVRWSYLGSNDRLYFDGTGGGQVSNAWGSPANFHLFTLRRSGTTITFRENKTSRGSFTYGHSGNVFFDQLGYNAVGGNIDIGELSLWTLAMSDADVDALYDYYFKPRWVTLP